MESESPLLIDVDEAAAFLGFTPRYIYDLTARREIPHVKIGRYVRFRRESLVAWVEASEIAPNGNGR